MKKLFRINTFFYLYALLLIISGYINYLLIYLIIMFFHELGHILVIKILGYKINSLTIYPFGCIIETNINLNIPSYHLFLISSAGILMQLLLFLIHTTNSYNYLIFTHLNISLIIYNLLPIIPTDGYKILMSLTENIFNYRKTTWISIIISSIFLFIFFYLTKNIIIFSILYIYNVTNIINYHHIMNKFYLERYLYPVDFTKVKYVNDLKDIYKCRKNYIKCDKIYQEERIFFENHFHKSY